MAVHVDYRGEVCVAEIQRPEVMNALNREVIEQITSLCEQLQSRTDIRVLLLQSSGAKAFVAGADIGAMAKMTPEEAEAFARLGQRMTRGLESLPQVTIARVQGFALGGGCEIAMACDLVICSDQAKFAQPEINLGLVPGFGGTQRLVRRVGLAVGLDVLIGGRHLDGQEAFQCGLASRVCKSEELDGEIEKTIKRILKGGPQAIAKTKQLARLAYTLDLDAGLDAEARVFKTCFEDSESHEGMSAFVEKRRASFAR